MKQGEVLAGRYRLERMLGRGGMGEVWQALDQRLERQVAVKVLLVTWSDEQLNQMLARFRREGKVVARLNHPRIATVYDSDTHEGWPFLVLELLAGPDLAALLDEHPGGLPVGMLLEYGAQAAEGLEAAHAMGVIHRDVKPSNLMLDGHGTLKICDFGIARLSGATVGLTTAGTRIGTFAYTPPEQLSGNSVTDAADVYALGATLFHLLTGRLLFPAEDLAAVIGQQLYGTPPPPSSLRPGVPQALDTYLLTLLAKDPASRPAAQTIPARLRALARQLGPDLLLADAERLARTISDDYQRAAALARIARVASTRKLAMAEKLLADAEPLARGANPRVTYKESEYAAMAQIRARMDVAAVTAEWNTAKATELLADVEPLTRQLYYPDDVEFLTDIAKLVRGWNLAMAEKLLADAERLARTASHRRQPRALGIIAGATAEAMATADPVGAERLACTVTDPRRQARVLVEIAKVISNRDPAAAVVLLSDAERLARTADPGYLSMDLGIIAKAMAEVDPAGAERLARTITWPDHEADALTEIAKVVRERDPAKAEELLADADRLVRAVTPNLGLLSPAILGRIARAMAEQNLATAERLARAVADRTYQAMALAEIAKVLMEQRAPLTPDAGDHGGPVAN